MGCYFCKLLFQPTVCVTYETLFHFYYKWNRKKLRDPQFLSRILSLYAGNTETLLYELELKYGGIFPMTYDDTLYLKYMERRLFNVYAEHTTRLQNEGIGFIFDLTESFRNNLDVLLNKANARYGADTTPIVFPLHLVTKADIPSSTSQEVVTTSQCKQKKVCGTVPGKKHLTIQIQPFVMSKDSVSISPYNESTIDVMSFDDFATDTSCEWDIVDEDTTP